MIRVIPASAHAAFWKAADYFKVKMHVIPVDEVSRKANVKRMRRAM
jgi:sphinganine-1-phosphate aldolase